MNGEYFSMVVCNSSRREIIKTKREMPIKKALEPLLKKWGYRDVSKLSVQLRYYEFELKAETQAGDTAGMEVFLKTEDSVDVILRGFHPFINKTSLKAFTQDYLNSDGWYLTRESSSGDGQLSLAVTYAKQLRHFKISFDLTDATYKIACKSFITLHQLIDYYKYNPLKKTPNGDIFLLFPIPKPDDVQSPVVKTSTNLPSKPVFNPARPLPPVPSFQSQPQLQLQPLSQPEIQSQHQVQPQPKLQTTKNHPKFKSNTLPRKLSITSPSPSPSLVDQTNRPLPPLPPLNEPPPQQKPKPDVPKKIPVNGLTTKPNRKDSSTPAPEKLGDNIQKNLLVFSQRNSPNPLPPNITHKKSPPTLPCRIEKQKSNPGIASLPTKIDVKQSNHLQARLAPTSPVEKISSPVSVPVPTQTHAPATGHLSNHVSVSSHASVPIVLAHTPNHGSASANNPSPAPPAVTQDVPAPWIQVYSKSQNKYYYFNPSTNATSWKLPKSTPPVDKSTPRASSTSSSPPNSVSSDPPVRQRSRTLNTTRKKKEISPELEPKVSFSAVTEEPKTKQFVRRAPSPPRQTSPAHKPQPQIMTKPKRNNSDYDILPPHPVVPPTNNHVVASNPKLKPKQSNLTQSKNSEPINSTPRIVTPNSPSTGKPVKVGRHVIPAPPPNLPPTLSNGSTHVFSNESAPRNTSNKGATLPSKKGLMSSIQDFKPGQLRPVTPDRSCSPLPESSSSCLMDVLRKRMEMRNEVIQLSDESDFEDADW